jgi:hypothetical protein
MTSQPLASYQAGSAPQGLAASARDLLFAGEANLFAVLDGASAPELRRKVWEEEPECECLYRGELELDMAEVAPYLVRLERNSPFSEWVLEQGWGNHWGVFAWSTSDLAVLRRHFRRFLMVHDPEGKPLYFRFYDPRVLRNYLPLCGPGELAEMFGPVTAYLLEGETPGTLLRFELRDGAVQCREETLR